jgi:hypothetical protein
MPDERISQRNGGAPFLLLPGKNSEAADAASRSLRSEDLWGKRQVARGDAARQFDHLQTSSHFAPRVCGGNNQQTPPCVTAPGPAASGP